MFGNLGFGEMFVILVVALVVLGPEKLPALARNIGKGLAEFRKAALELKTSISTELEDVQNPASWTAPPTPPRPPVPPRPAPPATAPTSSEASVASPAAEPGPTGGPESVGAPVVISNRTVAPLAPAALSAQTASQAVAAQAASQATAAQFGFDTDHNEADEPPRRSAVSTPDAPIVMSAARTIARGAWHEPADDEAPATAVAQAGTGTVEGKPVDPATRVD